MMAQALVTGDLEFGEDVEREVKRNTVEQNNARFCWWRRLPAQVSGRSSCLCETLACAGERLPGPALALPSTLNPKP